MEHRFFKSIRGARLRLPLTLAFALVVGFGSTAPLQVQAAGSPSVPTGPGQLIVKLAPGASIDAVNAKHGTKKEHKIRGTEQYLISTSNVGATIAANDPVLRLV